MKPFIFALLFASLSPIVLKAQDYKIVMVDHTGPNGNVDPSSKHIPFIITLRDTTLRSSPDGVLRISKELYEQRKDCMIREFSFASPADEQKYAEPQFTRSIRRLMDYCDQGILVAEKKMAGE